MKTRSKVETFSIKKGKSEVDLTQAEFEAIVLLAREKLQEREGTLSKAENDAREAIGEIEFLLLL